MIGKRFFYVCAGLLFLVLAVQAAEKSNRPFFLMPSGPTWMTEVIRVRGCEYVVIKDTLVKGVGLSHAGDCDNPIHAARDSIR